MHQRCKRCFSELGSSSASASVISHDLCTWGCECLRLHFLKLVFNPDDSEGGGCTSR